MKCDQDGYTNNRHVDAELEPRQECPLVGTVVSCVAGVICEQEWPEQRPRKEDVTGSESNRDEVNRGDSPSQSREMGAHSSTLTG